MRAPEKLVTRLPLVLWMQNAMSALWFYSQPWLSKAICWATRKKIKVFTLSNSSLDKQCNRTGLWIPSGFCLPHDQPQHVNLSAAILYTSLERINLILISSRCLLWKFAAWAIYIRPKFGSKKPVTMMYIISAWRAYSETKLAVRTASSHIHK